MAEFSRSGERSLVIVVLLGLVVAAASLIRLSHLENRAEQERLPAPRLHPAVVVDERQKAEPEAAREERGEPRETSVMARQVQGVVLTIARGQQQALVRDTLNELTQINAKVLGAVFNRAEARDFLDGLACVEFPAMTVARERGFHDSFT